MMAAERMSALMSSLASLFNSCATLFTIDVYQKLRPGKSERQYVTVGRVATGFVVLAGLIWIPIMKQMAGGGIYKYLQPVQGYLAPPITAVFLLGLFWRRINATSAFYGLVGGFALGMAKLIIEATVSQQGLTGGPLWVIAEFNFLYYSGVLLVVSTASIVALSFLTEPHSKANTKGIT